MKGRREKEGTARLLRRFKGSIRVKWDPLPIMRLADEVDRQTLYCSLVISLHPRF